MLYYCSFAYSHRNAFGRNQKLNISLERGQVDSMFRINYTDPWIEGDDKRTSRSINIQVRVNYTGCDLCSLKMDTSLLIRDSITCDLILMS